MKDIIKAHHEKIMKQQVIELKGEKPGVKFSQVFTSPDEAMKKYNDLKPLGLTLSLRTFKGITLDEYYDLKDAAKKACEVENGE